MAVEDKQHDPLVSVRSYPRQSLVSQSPPFQAEMTSSTRIFTVFCLFAYIFPTITCLSLPARTPSSSKACPEACRPSLSNGICDLACNIRSCHFDGGDCVPEIVTLEFSTIFGIRPISLIENLHGITNQSINFVFNSDGYPKIYDVISGRRIDPTVLIASGIYVTVDLAVDFTHCGIQACRFQNATELVDYLNSPTGKALFGMRSSFAYIHVAENKDKLYLIAVVVVISLIFAIIGATFAMLFFLCCCRRPKTDTPSCSSTNITTVSFVKTDTDVIEDLQMQLSNDEHIPGTTILHIAVIKNLSALIPVLIARGADPNAQRSDEESPLSLGVGMNSLSCVEELLKVPSINVNHSIGPNDTPLKRAIATGHAGLPIVRALLNRPDIDVNAVGDRCNCLSVCQTPMHAAAIHGNVAALKELIKSGADRRIADEEQKLPMNYALERGNVEIIGLLMDRRGESGFEINRYSIC